MPLLLADSGLFLVFQMASVDKSTVPPRDTLLVLLYRRALTQKEGRIREDENGQTKYQDI